MKNAPMPLSPQVSDVSSEYWTSEEMAALLKVTKETIRLKARKKRLPGVRLGRSWLFPRRAVKQVIENALREQSAADNASA